MLTISHIMLDTGCTQLLPRSEVRDEIIRRLQPLVLAGNGELAGLAWELVTKAGPLTVFTLGWRARKPLVRCWLCAESSPATWRGVGGETSEPPAPWLAVRLLPDALALPTEELFMLSDAQRCVAWTILASAAI